MAQQHLDRLSALDASFLHQEGPESHMHIGALTLFDAPAPQFDELLALIGARLHLVPRYRQRLARPPFDRGLPVWIDDAAGARCGSFGSSKASRAAVSHSSSRPTTR